MVQIHITDRINRISRGYKTDEDEFVFDTKEIKKELEGVSLLEPSVLLWIKDYINQNINSLKGDKR